MNGNNGDVEWCELGEEEVAAALRDNVQLNAAIYRECLKAAMAEMNLAKDHDLAAMAVNPYLRDEVRQLSATLFAQCAVKAFVALEEELRERTHEAKTNGIRH